MQTNITTLVLGKETYILYSTTYLKFRKKYSKFLTMLSGKKIS